VKKTHLFAILLLTALSALTLACNHESRGTDVSADPEVDRTAMIMAAADSMKRLRANPKATNKEILDHSLSNAAEAEAFMRQSGHWDEYNRGIIPSIARQDIKYAEKLLRSTHPYFLIADKGSMHVILFDRYGNSIKKYLMACSRHYGTKHKHRDNRTPEGCFEAEGVHDSRKWLYTDDDGYTSPAIGVYGPRFIRIISPVTRSVGIHGTNAPWSPGSRCSHGCIRLHNDNITDLVKYVQAGTPIIVNPGAKDDAVNRKEGYKVTMLDLGPINAESMARRATDEEIKRMPDPKEPAKADSAKTHKSEADKKDPAADDEGSGDGPLPVTTD